jgi:hypothetical protein
MTGLEAVANKIHDACSVTMPEMLVGERRSTCEIHEARQCGVLTIPPSYTLKTAGF